VHVALTTAVEKSLSWKFVPFRRAWVALLLRHNWMQNSINMCISYLSLSSLTCLCVYLFIVVPYLSLARVYSLFFEFLLYLSFFPFPFRLYSFVLGSVSFMLLHAQNKNHTHIAFIVRRSRGISDACRTICAICVIIKCTGEIFYCLPKKIIKLKKK
jgi:hypothetical protein